MMMKTKPKDYFCVPGMEYITKEGIDVVVFSDLDDIYDFSELQPFQLSYFDFINFVSSRNNMAAFVTHPYTIGLTSVINKLGQEAYSAALNSLNAVEISNGAFDNLYFLINKFPFKHIFRSKVDMVNKTRELPIEDYPEKIKIFAAGSDAHHVENIGNCYEMEYNINLKEPIFKIITSNLGEGKIVGNTDRKFGLILLLITAFTTFTEFVTKTILKYKL